MNNKIAIQILKTEQDEIDMEWLGNEGKLIQQAYDLAINALKNEKPQGEWLIDCPPQYADGAKCSLCKCNFFGALSFNYCPNCGADMRGDEE